MSKPLRTRDIIIQSQVGRETLRFYEREGLIPSPHRSESGYREYPPETIRHIEFIKVAQGTGFALKEIKEFLSLSHHRVTRDFVLQTVEVKIEVINEKIASLQAVKRTLRKLRTQTQQSHSTFIQCPVLGKICLRPSKKSKLRKITNALLLGHAYLTCYLPVDYPTHLKILPKPGMCALPQKLHNVHHLVGLLELQIGP